MCAIYTKYKIFDEKLYLHLFDMSKFFRSKMMQKQLKNYQNVKIDLSETLQHSRT